MGKKQKRAEAETEAERIENDKAENELELTNGDSHKKKKKRRRNKERDERDKEAKEIPTVSIAVSGSIINNAQSLELATRVLYPLYFSISIFSSIFNCFNFSVFVFSWLVKLLVPRLYFESMRFLY